jgi:tRNA(fMet)-specific endonuclease VapC
MGLLIDASILIQEERGRLDVAQNLQSRPDDEAFLSVVTASELLHGVHRARDERMRNQRGHGSKDFSRSFPP